MNVQLAPGSGDGNRIKNRHLREHGLGLITDTGTLTAGQPDHQPLHIGDNQHGFIKRVCFLVQRLNFFAGTRQTGGQGIRLILSIS